MPKCTPPDRVLKSKQDVPKGHHHVVMPKGTTHALSAEDMTATNDHGPP